MKNITYRRAQNRDAEVIMDILKAAFGEYDLKLPAGYSFTDIGEVSLEYGSGIGKAIRVRPDAIGDNVQVCSSGGVIPPIRFC